RSTVLLLSLFFFTLPAASAPFPLSLHDALPISTSAVTLAPFTTGFPACTCLPSLASSTRSNVTLLPGSASSCGTLMVTPGSARRSEEHTSELQSRFDLVCRLLLEKKNPFIQEPPSGDLQERVLIRHHDYDQCFQSVQLFQWNSQVKFNVTVYHNLPTTRDSIMTS